MYSIEIRLTTGSEGRELVASRQLTANASIKEIQKVDGCLTGVVYR